MDPDGLAQHSDDSAGQAPSGAAAGQDDDPSAAAASRQPSPRIRVLIVDDHEVVRLGLKALLAGADDVRIVGMAATAEQAVAEAARLHPDVVVMDLRLPDGSGVEACRDILAEHPATRVVMLTSYSDDEAVLPAIVAGACGYLLKHARGRDLVSAIRTVHGGASLLDPAVTEQVMRRLREPGPHSGSRLAELSDLERRILQLLAEGRTNREIAQVVYLGDTTVKHYVSSILRKLQVGRRSEAAAVWARQRPAAEPRA